MTTTKRPDDVGGLTRRNRTGIQASPKDSKALIDFAAQVALAPRALADGDRLHALCRDDEAAGTVLGTMPLPTTLKGVASAALTALKGQKANVLLDALGERLAFERSGVRLYESFLAKLEMRSAADGPAQEDVAQFLDEELAHFHLVREAMESLGGDPTAVTPRADVVAVASRGLVPLVTDPRTTTMQALAAIHIAELVDNDGWTMLIDLCDHLGQDQWVERFRIASAEEDEHLETVRRWLAEMTEAASDRADTDELPATSSAHVTP